MSSTVIGFVSKQGRRPRPVNEAWSKSADSTDDVLVLPMTTPERWDIFCSVADNYGDAGVAWRLARQLVAEHRRAVRLFVDTGMRRAELAGLKVADVDVFVPH